MIDRAALGLMNEVACNTADELVLLPPRVLDAGSMFPGVSSVSG